MADYSKSRGPYVEFGRHVEIRYRIDVLPRDAGYVAKPIDVVSVWKGVTHVTVSRQFREHRASTEDEVIATVRADVKRWAEAGAPDDD